VDPATKKVREASIDEVLARRLHDSSVTDALEEFLAESSGAGAVAVMGGHDKERGDPIYRAVAELCRQLARDGYLMVSGGGPGVMEATNLGAYLAPHPDEALDAAIAVLATAPKYNDPRWLSAAYEVRAKFPLTQPGKARSLGVPTWFYGHEPPNAFATHIAKYFENSVREEGLLAIAAHGVIFAEGNGGTVQEIFQDACQNYYKTYDRASPMFLFGEAQWNYKGDPRDTTHKRKLAWPLLQKLAYEKGFEKLVFLTDSPSEIRDRIRAFSKSLTAGG
jgi:predicted Rossmann-fold nucleotide-binding protein